MAETTWSPAGEYEDIRYELSEPAGIAKITTLTKITMLAKIAKTYCSRIFAPMRVIWGRVAAAGADFGSR